MAVPLVDDYKGCKLLLTSRSQDILQKNDTHKNFALQLLDGEESWRLFEATVGEDKDDEVRTIATQVAQKCLGFPVLIVTIAKSLKDKGLHYWRDTLNNLEKVDNKDVQETLILALKFNLNRLEDEVKKVFFLCGVHGTFIPISDLLKYAIGLGIFKHVDTIEGARNKLHRIIDDLKASCLLVDDDARSGVIKMHNSVREGAVLIASKFVFTKCNLKLQDWPRKDIPERCTHIILKRCYIQKLPERLEFPHLTFLHINSMDNQTLEIPDIFFEGVQNLEALDLTGMIMSLLPTSLRHLTKLKMLCLDFCSLKDMTGIGALINLEILTLIYSSMEEFPSEIEQLTRLRMLDLSNSSTTIKTTLPNILYKLTKIEELYMGNAIIKWEVESSSEQKTNASLPKLSHLICLTTLEIQVSEARLLPKDIPFDKLERYKIVIGDKWEWSNNKETLRLLKVNLDTSIRGEGGIKTLIERAEDLYLDNISGISNVLFELNGEGFPSLKHLLIQNNGEVQHIINSMKRNQTQALFPKLEALILQNLNNLVKICHGPIRNDSFGQLKLVKVESCDQLICLFSVSVIKAFSHLVEIEVSECNSMTKIVSLENAESGKIIDDNIEFLSLRSLTLQHLPATYNFYSHELTSLPRTKQSSLQPGTLTPFFSAKVKFSNLETLKLSSVNLKTIWDDKTPCLMENLANLTVEDCCGLKYLFSSSIIGRLSNLKQLEISKCDTMEKIVAIDENYGGATTQVLFPKLEAIIIKDMQNLKMIWQPILASNSLACFKTLEVKNCEKIEKIFPNYMNGALANLETLKVEGCMSVEEIFQLDVDAGNTTRLKDITLLQLPQLKQIWSKGSQSSLHLENLQVVRVEDCGDLEYLFPFSIPMNLPLLEQITIKRAKRMKEIVS
ncbi:disease resistance protein RPS2-like [Neltuma alba]|uniref:disease resistance protein RPS2-like n=1 Tax=Neltuma alba TaxID=207710 RepID=UPI0010A52A32|nr:disease resistance protein RPS2-like [Prosopis alba]